MQLALFEEFDKEGWHIIEWGGDELKNLLVNVGYIVFTVTITPYKDGRKYIIERDA